ncbi:MAG: cystathionine gamma-synthase [Candidatus Zixiibacteriota bacterium]
MSKDKTRFETRAIHAGQSPDPSTGAITTPIFQTSTYVQEGVGGHKGYEYSRTDNPTRTALQECLASLENAKYGLSFASGMSTISTIMNLLKAGDHVVSSDDVYGGTYRIFEQVFRNYDLKYDYVNTSNLSEIESAIKPETKMVWVETPTNPLLKITDLKGAAEICRKHNLISCVDNTFGTPYFQKPLDYGIDIVMHSVTKFLGGHADTVGGALMTSNDKLYDRLKFCQNAVGAIPGPFDCWLVLRGVKTLAVRMERHAQNAGQIANWLEAHPKVRKVIYPGLESHPGHEIAKKQMTGFGGLISFEIDGSQADAVKFLDNVKLFALAESLGGVESLIEHPGLMTHASIPAEVRHEKGLSDNLIRISVGIEHVDDLIADLDDALANL